MVYSKFLKQSNYFAGLTIKRFKLPLANGAFFKLNNPNKVCWGTNVSFNSRDYSTILNSNFSNFPKCASSLNFVAYLSTDGNPEKYKVVITNPSEGTTKSLDSSFSSVDEIKNVEKIPEILPETADISISPEIIDVAASPEIADIATSLTNELTSAADIIEPSLASLGLCNWTPVGLVQMLLEYMHISMHWPWWFSIVATTVIARIVLFPVILKTQKNAIHLSNCMPQLQFLQMKFGEARRTGNSMEAAKLSNEMLYFMKEKNINPLKNAIFPLIQAPVFLSFFFALRSMAKTPVESMKYGGVSWVSDLTIPDPYYVLPLVACGTLYVILKVGAESGVRMENLKMAKYLIQALPVLAFPFCINFPAAILYYWCANNFCTLLVVSILKIKPVRLYFNLPTQQPVDPKYIAPKKGFIQNVRDAFEDQKVLAAIEDRRRMDDIRFQKAGTGPIPRTYSYDPTKPRPSNVASAANKAVVAKERKT